MIFTVVLDTNLTPELIEEGFVREIVSKVQTMRKEAGFEVMDKIHIYAKDNDKILELMKNHKEEIMSEVLAEDMTLGSNRWLCKRMEHQQRASCSWCCKNSNL